MFVSYFSSSKLNTECIGSIIPTLSSLCGRPVWKYVTALRSPVDFMAHWGFQSGSSKNSKMVSTVDNMLKLIEFAACFFFL